MALATIVSVQGSAYRRPGARMLVVEDGSFEGTISGGCLERDVAIRAQTAIESRKTSVLQYSTTGSDDDVLFGVGAGCNGGLEIFIEPIDDGQVVNPLRFIQECCNDRTRGVLATILGAPDDSLCGAALAISETRESAKRNPLDDASVPIEIGMFLVRDELKPDLLARIEVEALRVLSSEQNATVQIDHLEGTVTLFLEFIQPPVRLIVCGGGTDAIPIVSIAREIGWNTVVIDPRSAYASRERFPQADAVVCGGGEQLGSYVHDWKRVAVVVMTHNYNFDLSFLHALCNLQCGYVGMLGPRQRTMRLQQELFAQSAGGAAALIQHLHSPVGLDIGSETEQEIALAVVSEVQAALSQRPGGFLKNRPGAIHQLDRNENGTTSNTENRAIRSCQTLDS